MRGATSVTAIQPMIMTREDRDVRVHVPVSGCVRGDDRGSAPGDPYRLAYSPESISNSATSSISNRSPSLTRTK